MAGTRGYFKDGRWIEEKEHDNAHQANAGGAGETKRDINNLVDETRRSVNSAISNITLLSKTLLGTEQGRAHLGLKAREAGERLETAIEEITEAVEELAKDAKKKLKE
ncbi:MAG: hypothetical protein GKC04_03615 [Methanomicrobiales archaeon]|nr:hypothetical protein [Methanomicrobiales archaeon]